MSHAPGAAIVRDLTEEIGEVLETYAKHGAVDARELPLSHPLFDDALRKMEWRIARTLGQDTSRFYALLRDTATGCLNSERDNLFYIVVAGQSPEVQRHLGGPEGITRFCEAMRAYGLIGETGMLRMASYTLSFDDVVAMTPGQIGRIGQQFYDPISRFGQFKGQILPPSTNGFSLCVLVGKRSRPIGSEPDWLDGVCDPYREAHWETETRRPLGTRTLTVHACRSWSELGITAAFRQVINALSALDEPVTFPIDQDRTHIEVFTHPDGLLTEISICQGAVELGPVTIPSRLIAHNRYGFHQMLLNVAPLHVDGETIC
jgi:hypothetical protein